MAQLVVSSDDKENFNGQGYVTSTADVDYDTVHDGVGQFVTNYNRWHITGQRYNIYSSGEYQIFRPIMRFDLSSLPAGASIISAVLTLLAGAYIYHYTEWDFVLVDGSDCGDPLVAGDYQDLLDEVISLGSIAVSAITESQTFEITLNAAGRAFLESKAGGVAVIAVRSSDDIDSIAPTGDYVQNQRTTAQFSLIDTTDFPYITITYGVLKGNPNIDQRMFQHVERIGR